MARVARSAVAILAFSCVCAVMTGCSPSKPQVICTMRNPQTGQTVEMYKEMPFKVPANYDEKRHIAQWKQEQAGKGFSVEVVE